MILLCRLPGTRFSHPWSIATKRHCRILRQRQVRLLKNKLPALVVWRKARAGGSEAQEAFGCYRGALGSYDFAAASAFRFFGTDAGSKLPISVAVRDPLK